MTDLLRQPQLRPQIELQLLSPHPWKCHLNAQTKPQSPKSPLGRWLRCSVGLNTEQLCCRYISDFLTNWIPQCHERTLVHTYESKQHSFIQKLRKLFYIFLQQQFLYFIVILIYWPENATCQAVHDTYWVFFPTSGLWYFSGRWDSLWCRLGSWGQRGNFPRPQSHHGVIQWLF